MDGWPGINQESTTQAFPLSGGLGALGIKLFSTWALAPVGVSDDGVRNGEVLFGFRVDIAMIGWFRLAVIPVSGIRVKVCRWSFVASSYYYVGQG